MLINFLFCWLVASLDTGCSRIDTSHTPKWTSPAPTKLVGDGIDGIELRVCSYMIMQLRISSLPLEYGKCITSRTPIIPTATPATIGNRTEQHIYGT
jgi:hypothetical protein